MSLEIPVHRSKFYVYAAIQNFVYQSHYMRSRLQEVFKFKDYVLKLKDNLNIQLSLIIETKMNIIYDESIWRPQDKTSYGNILSISFDLNNLIYMIDYRLPIEECVYSPIQGQGYYINIFDIKYTFERD